MPLQVPLVEQSQKPPELHGRPVGQLETQAPIVRSQQPPAALQGLPLLPPQAWRQVPPTHT